jgi:hypothetical protein
MNYRYQIQGRYFLVVLFFLNIMALLPVVFLIKDPTRHEPVVMAGIWAYVRSTQREWAGVFGPSCRSR